jgi:predicted enzyme related to lactoylglutathione lyase
MTRSDAQQRTYPAGVTSWIDLEVDDVAAAQDFYGSLFGWTFETATPPGVPPYVIAQLDGQDVGGIGGPPPHRDRAHNRWNTYVAVDDAEAAVRKVEEAGGRVVDPVEQAGEGGWNATIADPAGVEIRLWQARNRPGAQVTNSPGSWNFSDLHAADPAASQPFYEQVFGWQFVDMGFATMIQVPGYGDHLAATVDPGIHERQASAPPGFADVIGGVGPAGDLGPHWHVTFTVAERDETATRAESLGATALGRSEDQWTRQVVLRDPQGAVFTASQFTPSDDW